MHFTQEDYKKIESWLLRNSVKDTEFQEAFPLNGKETVTVVQDGHNRKINVKDLIEQLLNIGIEDFINVTSSYDSPNISLNEAIRLIPDKARQEGQVITFLNKEGNWEIYQFTGKLNQWNNHTLWNNPFDWKKFIINSILPDEEDITKSAPDANGNSYLSLKDKLYEPEEYSGLGRKYLKKRIIDVNDPIYGRRQERNLLLQEDFIEENTVYIIRYDFNLNKENIIIPKGCVLEFQGGTLNNGTIIGDNTFIKAEVQSIFKEGIYLEGTWNALEVYPEWFGAKGNGYDDDTIPLEKCFNFSANQKLLSKLSSKTYIVCPNKEVLWNVAPTQPSYIMHAAFLIKSHMHIKGDVKTVLKIKDKYSTIDNPMRFSMFFTNEILENVSFKDIIFDMNGTNNRFSKNLGEHNFGQTSIYVSCIYNETYCARIKNVLIEKCQFINSSGVNNIVMGVPNSNTNDSEKSSNWTIRGCIFKNNGLDTEDLSSIYAYGDNIICENNIFTADTGFPNGLHKNNNIRCGSVNAYEIHGSNQYFINNIVQNHEQALWVTPVSDSIENIYILNNIFSSVSRWGIRLRTSNEQYIHNIIIENNIIEFDDGVDKYSGDYRGADLGYKTGDSAGYRFYICGISLENNIKSCKIKGNTIKIKDSINIGHDLNGGNHLSDKRLTFGIMLYGNNDNISIIDNVVERLNTVIYITATNELGHIELQNNTFKNLYTAYPVYSGSPYSQVFNSKVLYTINDNMLVDSIILDNNIYRNLQEIVDLKGVINSFQHYNEKLFKVDNYIVNKEKVTINNYLSDDARSVTPQWRVDEFNDEEGEGVLGTKLGIFKDNKNLFTLDIELVVFSFPRSGVLEFHIQQGLFPKKIIRGNGYARVFSNGELKLYNVEITPEYNWGKIIVGTDENKYMTDTYPLQLTQGDTINVHIECLTE